MCSVCYRVCDVFDVRLVCGLVCVMCLMCVCGVWCSVCNVFDMCVVCGVVFVMC